MQDIKVSVVMPTYNRANYIGQAIDSILKQTFENIELIIIDDASNDHTESVVKMYDDSRIVYIKNSINKGVAYSRNVGYKNAQGKYIVIADSDDINHVNRIEKMVDFLEKNTEYDIVVTNYQVINEFGDLGETVHFKKNNEELYVYRIFNSGIPSFMMFRKNNLEERKYFLHDESYEAAVDYQWYSALDKSHKIGILEEVLYFYRRHTNQISTQGFNIQQKYADKIRKQFINKIGIKPTELEMNLHSSISKWIIPNLDDNLYIKYIDWFTKLSNANLNSKVFNSDIFDKILNEKLVRLIEYHGYFDDHFYDIYITSKFGNINNYPSFNIQLEKLENVISDETSNIYIFGSKYAAYAIAKKLIDLKINVEGFLDNNTKIVGRRILGKRIISPSEIIDGHEKLFIISILSDARFEISEYLTEKMNMSQGNIIIFRDL